MAAARWRPGTHLDTNNGGNKWLKRGSPQGRVRSEHGRIQGVGPSPDSHCVPLRDGHWLHYLRVISAAKVNKVQQMNFWYPGRETGQLFNTTEVCILLRSFSHSLYLYTTAI
uniref:Uncharacterized protein n=1 Tax=Branchiostoma floridae TaxID=7739 RepID=C3Z5F0_BRAFL|eukprot:XP_002596051.1 hypothetical protein BRAFLDRAFT_66217 [Branchiostoma floridae]